MRLLAVALLVESRIRVGGRFMGVVGALVAVEVRAIAPSPSDPSLARKLLCDAQAWISVPSTVK